MFKLRVPFLVAFTLIFLVGCGASVKELPKDPARYRNFQFEQNNIGENFIYYVPKGVFITQVKDNEMPQNSWIRLTPGDQWPAYEPRPTLLTGHVVERKKDYARLEILDFVRSLSGNYPLKAEVYPTQIDIAKTLHSIGKRVIFPSDPFEGNKVLTTLSQDSMISGSELYGALDADAATTGRRFAASITALMKVPAEDVGQDSIHLQTQTGVVPANPIFVLLDAPLVPSFRVQLRIANISDSNEIRAKIKSLLNQNIPGTEFIELSDNPASNSIEETIAQLGGTQTETLEVVLTSNHQTPVIIDQALRVEDSPYTVILTSNNPEITALAMVARALEMLGYPASEALVLEQAYQTSDSLETKAALVPAIASAWHILERDDWALELGLEQLALADVASKSERKFALSAAAVAFSICSRSTEFPAVFHEVHALESKLPTAWQKILAYASIQSHTNHFISKKDWNEFDTMFECMITKDEDLCEEGLENSTTPLGNTWFSAQLAILQGDTSEILNYAEPLDSLGAPNLSKQLWIDMISSGLTGKALVSAIISAAHYARISQQTRPFVHLMEGLMSDPESSDFAPYSEAVSVWKSLDLRYELATFSLTKSNFSPPGESIELKTFAAELLLSTADPQLSRIYQKLSLDYAQIGQNEKADEYRQRAIDFSQGTQFRPYSPDETE